MFIAVLYLIFVAIEMAVTNGGCHLNATHILVAAGIIGVCTRLDDLKKKTKG